MNPADIGVGTKTDKTTEQNGTVVKYRKEDKEFKIVKNEIKGRWVATIG